MAFKIWDMIVERIIRMKFDIKKSRPAKTLIMT
jgi:hypothetical protein